MATSDVPNYHWIKGGGYWTPRYRLAYARWRYWFFSGQQTTQGGGNHYRRKRGRHANK